MNNMIVKFELGNYEKLINNSLNKLDNEKIVERIWKKDYTIWSDKPDEVANRLDWLQSPSETLSHLDEINSFVNSAVDDGFTNALLLGMGGSSLAPEVFRLSFGVEEDYLDLSVLDSTDPGAILNLANGLDIEKTLFIVSTKSGGTIETLSFFKFFYNFCLDKLGKEKTGNHFVAITDPGSKLEELAKKLNFRKTFLNNPNIGGRYSVLSFFGSVPAALLGINLQKLLNDAFDLTEELKTTDNNKNSGAKIGVTIAELAKIGKDKLTFVYSEQIKSFGTWVEQLIAESTGKNGVGILPVESEVLESPEYYSNDRVFVYTHFNNDNSLKVKIDKLKNAGHPIIEIVLNDIYNLGGEFLRWEFATAVAGWVLGIQPFNQPNVESAKIEAKAMINDYLTKGELPKLEAILTENGITIYGNIKANSVKETMHEFLSLLNDKTEYNYVAIQAYVTPSEETEKILQKLRTKIQKEYKVAVTLGYGPRFLHSTGQLHKGDAGKGLFIQFTSSIKEDVKIPREPGSENSDFTFGILKTAQLLGDRQALLNANRKVITIDLGTNVNDNITKLM